MRRRLPKSPLRSVPRATSSRPPLSTQTSTPTLIPRSPLDSPSPRVRYETGPTRTTPPARAAPPRELRRKDPAAAARPPPTPTTPPPTQPALRPRRSISNERGSRPPTRTRRPQARNRDGGRTSTPRSPPSNRPHPDQGGPAALLPRPRRRVRERRSRRPATLRAARLSRTATLHAARPSRTPGTGARREGARMRRAKRGATCRARLPPPRTTLASHTFARGVDTSSSTAYGCNSTGVRVSIPKRLRESAQKREKISDGISTTKWRKRSGLKTSVSSYGRTCCKSRRRKRSAAKLARRRLNR
mmetsp:Transcript_44064/g.84204  ORF Transcript_44064/g.84204 Transcript_44064/m.84204 type:complete len:302 (+) Transcript_44064:1973-2878(+)